MLLLFAIIHLLSKIFIIDSCTVPAVINGSVGHYVRVRQHQTFYQFVKFEVGKTFQQGESAFLLCDEDFIPEGSSTSGGGSGQPEIVFCGNGNWSKPMFCKPVSCLANPPPIENGYPVVNNRSHGHVISYVCNENYVKVEPGTVECHYGTWKGHAPACVDGRCYTRELNYPGFAKTEGEYANHLGYVQVTCTKGYTVYQNGTKIQCNKGLWYVPHKLCVKDGSDPYLDTEHPKNNCVCAVYHQDRNLQAVINGHKQHAFALIWRMGDTAHLSCADSSMNLVWSNGSCASPSLTCDKCRRWNVNDIPLCQTPHKDPEIRCSRFSDNDMDVLNVDYEDKDIRVGSKAIFSCRNDNQTLNGTRTAICLRSGEWSSSPPQCRTVTCEVPSPPDHGTVILPHGPKVGMKALYSCEDGKTLVGSSVSECLVTGEWTSPQPKCLQKCSSEPPEIPHGKVNFTSRDQDSEAKYECELGYNMSGRPAVKCLFGEWSGQPPDCVRENCSSQPPEILHGRIKNTSSEVEYECDPGYSITGGSTVKCLYGKWSGQPPVCVEEKCTSEPPEIPHGGFHYTSRDHNSEVKYECDTGYNISLNSTVKCLYGKWSGQPPVCVEENCSSQPPEILHGRIKNTSSEVEYECDPGYNITGGSTVKCLYGKWSGQPPVCVEEKCTSEPPEIPHGGFHYTSRDHNSEVKYECEKGYNISLHSTVKCLYGKWGGQPPVCVEMKCSSNPPQIKNGHFYYTRRDPIPEIEYDCYRGYNLTGNTVKCLNGKWRGTPPVCVRAISYCYCKIDPRPPRFSDRAGYAGSVLKGQAFGVDCLSYGDYQALIWPNGLRTVTGAMFCDECDPWRPSAVPTCVNRHDGDAIIARDINNRFQHTGALERLRGERLEIGCFSLLKEYPRWDYSHTTEQLQVIKNVTYWGIYASYLIIPEFSPKHVGIYECSTSDKNRPPAKYDLRMKGYPS